MKFQISGDDAKIEIVVISRSHPNFTDYWDGNWITSTIKIEIPGYKAQFNADLQFLIRNEFNRKRRINSRTTTWHYRQTIYIE